MIIFLDHFVYLILHSAERIQKIGKEEGKIEVTKTMLANNVDVNTIVKFTGLSISEIEELSVSGYK